MYMYFLLVRTTYMKTYEYRHVHKRYKDSCSNQTSRRPPPKKTTNTTMHWRSYIAPTLAFVRVAAERAVGVRPSTGAASQLLQLLDLSSRQ